MRGECEYKNEMPLAEQKHANIHVHDGVSREEFIHLRTARDKTLNVFALQPSPASGRGAEFKRWASEDLTPTYIETKSATFRWRFQFQRS